MSTSSRAPASTAVVIPGFPALPGLRIRPYAGPVDHEGMVAANNAWRTSLGVTELVTREGFDNEYANLTNSDPYRDCLAVELDGRIVGYRRTEWADDDAGARVMETNLILGPAIASETAYRALLRDGEAHLRRGVGERAAQPRDRFRVWTWDGDAALEAAYAAEGYRVARRFFEMVRPNLDAIPTVPLPGDLEVRPVAPDHWRAVWEADVEAFRDHWGEVDEGETGFQRFLGEPALVPELWQVAWDGEQVAGHVIVAIDTEANARFGFRRGVLHSVAVRRPYRRRGLARALTLRTLAALRDHGETSATLGVDAANAHGAVHLYESCGFEVERSGSAYEKPFA